MGNKLNLKWISETIGEEYKKWNKGDIVKIQAQTGTGKTYFIKSILIPHMENWEHMLLVCNRINLKRQLKKDLITYYKEEMPKTLKELDDLKTIGNITILSYQTIAELRNADNHNLTKFDLDRFDYIVCDEAHFFFSDGAFNNKCLLAFNALVGTRHRDAIKIFISATMDEIGGSLNLSVDKIHEITFGSYSKCKLWEYTTGIDYSYLDTKYFKNIKDIATTIKNDKSEYKWLVFVTKKADAEYLKKYLKNSKKVNIITKDTDITSNEDLQSIITESKYKSDVLICTKAMDNGINIVDLSVKNIVIMAWDKISFIQELGRIRIDIENSLILNLYIPTMSWSAFNTLIKKKYGLKNQLLDLYEKERDTFNARYNYEYDKLPKDIFILDKEKGWKVNSTGLIRLIKDEEFAKKMCKAFNKKRDPDAKVFSYVKEQLKWIGQVYTFDMFNLIEEVVDGDEMNILKDFLENCIGIKVLKEQQEELTDLIIRKFTTIGNEINTKTKKVHVDTINSILKNDLKIPYNITATKTSKRENGKIKKYTYWTIIKTMEI